MSMQRFFSQCCSNDYNYKERTKLVTGNKLIAFHLKCLCTVGKIGEFPSKFLSINLPIRQCMTHEGIVVSLVLINFLIINKSDLPF